MRSWLKSIKNRRWAILNALVLAIMLAVLGVQVTDKPTGRGISIGNWFGGEKVITLGPASAFAAGAVDYTFDGVADNVQFQAALNALPATGGRLVIVSATTIVFAATVTRAIDNVTIEGSGRGTYFTYDAVNPIFTAGGNNWQFVNIRTDAGSLSMGATTGWAWNNVTIAATYYAYRTPIASTTSASWEIPTGRGATLTVCASDALRTSQCDYIADGTDDLATIQAAHDAISASGGSIALSDGIFVTGATPLNITKNRVTVTGQGRHTRIQVPAGFVGVIDLIEITGSRAVLRDFLMDGQRTLVGGGTQTGIDLNNSAQATLDSLEIINFNGDGVIGQAISFVTVVNSAFSSITDDALDINPCARCVIANNSFDTIGDNAIDTETALNTSITGNVIQTCGGNGIEVEAEGSDWSEYLAVSGNTIRSCLVGIEVGSGRYNSIVGNTLEGNTTGVRFRTANGASYSTDNTVVGNTIRGGTYGIREMDANQTRNLISGNNVTGAATANYALLGSQTTSDVPKGFTVTVATADTAEPWKANYIGDGAADWATINTAIAALPASGGIVRLLDGTFGDTITGAGTPVRLSIAGMTLEGAGHSTVLTALGATYANNILEVTAANVTARNFKIDGNGGVITGSTYALLVNTVNGVTLDNIYITNTFRHAFAAISSDNLTMLNLRTDTTGDDGIALWDVNGALIDGYYCELGTSANGGSSCIEIEDDTVVANSSYIQIRNFTMLDPNNRLQNYGIYFPTNNDTHASWANISIGPGIIQNMPNGIAIYGGATNYAQNIELVGVQILNSRDTASSDGTGLFVRYADDVRIVGGTYSNNDLHGIHFRNVNGGSITGATIRNNGQTAANSVGIDLRDSTYITVTGNSIVDDQGVPTQDWGVYEEATSNNNIVVANAIYGNVTAQVVTVGAATMIRSNIGYVTENSGAATLGGGTATNGTGTMTGSPVTLIPGVNTPTITVAGTFTINLPAGNTGTATSGAWVITGSPVALVAGDNVITVEGGGGPGTITITTASTAMTVSHGLAATPTRAQITATNDSGAANDFWVSAKGASTFTINARTAVTNATTFDWRAVVGEGN